MLYLRLALARPAAQRGEKGKEVENTHIHAGPRSLRVTLLPLCLLFALLSLSLSFTYSCGHMFSFCPLARVCVCSAAPHQVSLSISRHVDAAGCWIYRGAEGRCIRLLNFGGGLGVFSCWFTQVGRHRFTSAVGRKFVRSFFEWTDYGVWH